LASRVAAGGIRQGLILWRSPLRCDCAALIEPGPAPRNSLRALRPLRSNRRGEHELKRASAPVPSSIITAATEIAPAGYHLPRRHHRGVRLFPHSHARMQASWHRLSRHGDHAGPL